MPPLSAPSHLVATGGDHKVALSWAASAAKLGRVAGYRIYRANALIARVAATRYTDTGLTNGDTYRYHAVAYDRSGDVSAASHTASATPRATPPRSKRAPALTASPVLSGATIQRQTLSTTRGVWTNRPTSYAYQWQDCDGSGGNCANISGATSSSYTLAASDVGHTIRVVVTASNRAGSTPATSSATAAVTASGGGGGGTTPQPTGPSGTWNLAFDDEFNGTSLDRTHWSPCWFYPTCGSQNGVATSPNNVQVANGNLILTLASSSSGASVETNSNGGAGTGYQFTEGVVEARIWMPGDGSHCYNWPGFWTDGQNWPSNGENDIAEVLDGPLTVNYHSSQGDFYFGPVAGYWCGGYHTYTLNRTNNHADVYYDGTLVDSYTTNDSNSPQYIILNVGVRDGTYPQYPSQVKVDYVRAWTPHL